MRTEHYSDPHKMSALGRGWTDSLCRQSPPPETDTPPPFGGRPPPLSLLKTFPSLAVGKNVTFSHCSQTPKFYRWIGIAAADLCTSQKIKAVLGKTETFDLDVSHEEPEDSSVQEELDLFELSKSNLYLVTVMNAIQVFHSECWRKMKRNRYSFSK